MAVGGALTGNGNYNFLINDPAGLATNPDYATVGVTGISQQIGAFTVANPAGVLSAANALTLLWGGPNDFFLGFAQFLNGMTVDFAALTAQAVFNMAANIVALATGPTAARNILVPNMPDLGLTPALLAAPAGVAALATDLTDAYNFGLAAAIAKAATDLEPLGVRLYTFDTSAFFRDAVGSPPDGITVTGVPCVFVPGALEAGCPGFLFFDGVHPTTFAHGLLANEFHEAVIPEPSTYALMALGLLALAFASRRRRA
jgi:phospholipase/lecithinase/hemolysin